MRASHLGRVTASLAIYAAFTAIAGAQEQEAEDIYLTITAANCTKVMDEINAAEAINLNSLTLASRFCHVARLSEHVERERLRLSAEYSDFGGVRSLEDAGDAQERAAILALQRLEDQLGDAIVRRDDLLEQVAEADPHEVNDLLRRLLGKKPEGKN